MAIEWTDAHAREAMRYLLRMAEEAVGAGDVDPGDPRMIAFDDGDVVDEDGFCTALNSWEADPTPALRRVDALATGRLVRETVWRADRGLGRVFESADRSAALAARGSLGRLIRVTRIRKP